LLHLRHLEEYASFLTKINNISMNNNNECGNNSNVVLNPDFVTGLIDAEGCFSVRV
jgi:hypothetical protein